MGCTASLVTLDRVFCGNRAGWQDPFSSFVVELANHIGPKTALTVLVFDAPSDE
jgi:hypothetical protein